MGRNYLNPQAAGYLLEAKGCEKVIKELECIVAKFERKVSREKSARQAEFEKVMQYRSEYEIQDDYGYGFLTEAQYERYLEIFRSGQAALEKHSMTVNEVSLNILRRILGDIAAELREWTFSALSPEQQRAERERSEKAQMEWKNKIAEIKWRRGIIEANYSDVAGE